MSNLYLICSSSLLVTPFCLHFNLHSKPRSLILAKMLFLSRAGTNKSTRRCSCSQKFTAVHTPSLLMRVRETLSISNSDLTYGRQTGCIQVYDFSLICCFQFSLMLFLFTVLCPYHQFIQHSCTVLNVRQTNSSRSPTIQLDGRFCCFYLLFILIFLH
jgi:hypothetical protein